MIRKVIETPALVAVLEVPAHFSPAEPDEPYLDPTTVKFLAEARRRATAGDTAWLRRHKAKLYLANPAA